VYSITRTGISIKTEIITGTSKNFSAFWNELLDIKHYKTNLKAFNKKLFYLN
jgi:hypothetical protein